MLLGAGCVAALGLVGCGRGTGESVKVYPVTGKVTVDGKPAPAADIVLHPVAVAQPAVSVRPRARVDADGSFALTSFETKDGAPAGEYKVTVAWTQPVASGRKPVEGDDVPRRSLLSKTYADPNTTPLRATVQPGTNDPLVLTITRK